MRKKGMGNGAFALALYLLAGIFFCTELYLVWVYVEIPSVRYLLFGLQAGIFLLAGIWVFFMRRNVDAFSDEICVALDDLISEKDPHISYPLEDSLVNKVQGKLAQYADIMRERQRENVKEKLEVQGLVSDISHQVKTPMANIRLYTNLLKQQDMPLKKRQEFEEILQIQVNKLDFLLEALVKMSRLETGTFTMHVKEAPLYDTLLGAVNSIWHKADKKDISLSLSCGREIRLCHDVKWTAEAITNILDNAVKYTPKGGEIKISVLPWQFYTKIDISDNGPGIKEEHYHDIFKRFYRAQETADQEGVGLGLYLAQGIITRQKGYISVKSEVGAGTTFSVHLLNG